LICFAKSLATVASFVWNFLTALKGKSDKTSVVIAFPYLARSAALNPAPATIIVCGAPFFLLADHIFVVFPENFSKKLGRLSRFLGLSKEVVS
jgi:hypothetical protein